MQRIFKRIGVFWVMLSYLGTALLPDIAFAMESAPATSPASFSDIPELFDFKRLIGQRTTQQRQTLYEFLNNLPANITPRSSFHSQSPVRYLRGLAQKVNTVIKKHRQQIPIEFIQTPLELSLFPDSGNKSTSLDRMNHLMIESRNPFQGVFLAWKTGETQQGQFLSMQEFPCSIPGIGQIALDAQTQALRFMQSRDSASPSPTIYLRINYAAQMFLEGARLSLGESLAQDLAIDAHTVTNLGRVIAERDLEVRAQRLNNSQGELYGQQRTTLYLPPQGLHNGDGVVGHKDSVTTLHWASEPFAPNPWEPQLLKAYNAADLHAQRANLFRQCFSGLPTTVVDSQEPEPKVYDLTPLVDVGVTAMENAWQALSESVTAQEAWPFVKTVMDRGLSPFQENAALWALLTQPDNDVRAQAHACAQMLLLPVVEGLKNVRIGTLGTIHGERISLDISAQEPTFQNGTLLAKEGIVVRTASPHLACLTLQGVTAKAPLLELDVAELFCDTTLDCDRTIIHRRTEDSFTLTQPYRTRGTLEFWQQGFTTREDTQQAMVKRFGTSMGDDAIESTHTLTFHASVKAPQGLKILCPQARVVLGEDGISEMPEWLLENGMLEVYATQLDIPFGGIVAKSGMIWAPKGLTLGTLVEAPDREVFQTFFSHKYNRGSHNLGTHHIRSGQYTLQGKKYSSQVFDGRHLLRTPWLVPNGSFMQIKEELTLQNPVNHYGSITTQDLYITAPVKVSIMGPRLRVSGGMHLAAGTVLHLERAMGEFYFYYLDMSWRTYHTINSDAPDVRIEGSLLGSKGAKVINEGGEFYAYQKSPGIAVEDKKYTITLYQKVIEGTPEERQKLRNASGYAGFYKGYCSARNTGVTIPSNFIYDRGCANYAVGFLQATNDFEGAQNTFKANNSSPTALTAPVGQDQALTTLEGTLSAPLILLRVGSGGVRVGQIGELRDISTPMPTPIQDLMQEMNFGIPIQHTSEFAHLFATQSPPRIDFMLREKYFHDAFKAHQFYEQLRPDVWVRTPDHQFRAMPPSAVMALSPDLLLQKVQKTCQKTLHRGYMEEGQALTLDYLKTLHKNTTAFVKEAGLQATSATQPTDTQDLQPLDQQLRVSLNPMLFYDTFSGTDGTQILQPFVFIPPKMLERVHKAGRSQVITRLFLTVPEDMQPHELMHHLADKPHIQAQLAQMLQHEPQMLEGLMPPESLALAPPSDAPGKDLHHPQPTVSDLALAPSGRVEIHGDIDASEGVGLLNTGSIQITGDIETKQALLWSLLEDVSLESQVHRVYQGRSDTFYDHVPHAARVKAQEILQIVGRNVGFQGAETDSGLHTHVEALANIIDVPVELVSQSVQEFKKKKKRGTITDRSIQQQTSFHRSGGKIAMGSGQGFLGVAPRYKAKQLILDTQEDAQFLNACTVFERHVDVTKKKRRLYGTKKKHTQSVLQQAYSRGALFDVEAGVFITMRGKTLTLVAPKVLGTMDIEAPQGIVHFALGENTLQQMSARLTKRGTMWVSAKQVQEVHRTYTQPSLQGRVRINAARVIAESVTGQTNAYLRQLQDGGVDYAPVWFQEQHQRIKHYQSGPGRGLSALVAIAITVVTQGAGASLVGAAPGTTAAAMANAGLTTIATHGTLEMLSTGGDLGRVLESFGKPQFLKKLAVNVGTAGISHTIATEVLELPADHTSMGQHVALTLKEKALWAAVRHGVATVLETGIQGQKFGRTLQRRALMGVAEVGGAELAQLLGQSYRLGEEGEINYVTHKLGHALVGGGMGALLSTDDRGRGALTGALSGMLSEVVAEKMLDPQELGMQLVRGEMTPSGLQTHLHDAVRNIRLGLSTLALLAHGDPQIADTVSQNALENNSWVQIVRATLSFLASQTVKKAPKLLKEGTKKSTKTLKKGVSEGKSSGVEQIKKTNKITSSSPRDKNKLKPDPRAKNDHTVFQKDELGRVKKYETYKANPKNPVTGFDSVKRVDMEGYKHYNKSLKEYIPTPHVQSKNIPGGVRKARPDEIPGSYKK